MLYLSIYSPLLGQGETELHQQLLFYYSRDGGAVPPDALGKQVTDENGAAAVPAADAAAQLRHIGLAQGVVEFGRVFSDDVVSLIKSKRSIIAVEQIEPNYWIVASVARSSDADSAASISSSSADQLLRKTLVASYAHYHLIYGSIEAQKSQNLDQLRQTLFEFYSNWCINYNEHITHFSLGLLLDGYLTVDRRLEKSVAPLIRRRASFISSDIFGHDIIDIIVLIDGQFISNTKSFECLYSGSHAVTTLNNTTGTNSLSPVDKRDIIRMACISLEEASIVSEMREKWHALVKNISTQSAQDTIKSRPDLLASVNNSFRNLSAGSSTMFRSIFSINNFTFGLYQANESVNLPPSFFQDDNGHSNIENNNASTENNEHNGSHNNNNVQYASETANMADNAQDTKSQDSEEKVALIDNRSIHLPKGGIIGYQLLYSHPCSFILLTEPTDEQVNESLKASLNTLSSTIAAQFIQALETEREQWANVTETRTVSDSALSLRRIFLPWVDDAAVESPSVGKSHTQPLEASTNMLASSGIKYAIVERALLKIRTNITAEELMTFIPLAITAPGPDYTDSISNFYTSATPSRVLSRATSGEWCVIATDVLRITIALFEGYQSDKEAPLVLRAFAQLLQQLG